MRTILCYISYICNNQNQQTYVYKDGIERWENDDQPEEGWIEWEKAYAIYLVLLKH